MSKPCIALAALTSLALGGPLMADENAELIVEGEKLVTRTAAPDGHPLGEVLSGWRFRTSETQALQTDDFDNPAFVFVDQARDAWGTPEGAVGKSCADCHGDVADSMAGVRAGMPKWNDAAEDLWSMENYINDCRTARMQAEPWKWDKPDMNAMVALIGSAIARTAGECRHRWAGGALFRAGQRDVLYPVRPARAVLCVLP